MKKNSMYNLIAIIPVVILMFKFISMANFNQRISILWTILALVEIVLNALIIILWADKINRLDITDCVMRTFFIISLMICFASISFSLVRKQENLLIEETDAKIYFNDREISKKEIEKINYKHFKYDEKNNVINLSN